MSATAKPIANPYEFIVTEYPGAGLRLAAFFVDGILIAILCAVFFPFSSLVESLGSLGWVPAYMTGCMYFGWLEGSGVSGRSLGKRWLSMRVATLNNKKVSTFTATLRAALV